MGKRSYFCKGLHQFDLENFTKDPDCSMGPHTALPRHLDQFLKWDLSTCPLPGLEQIARDTKMKKTPSHAFKKLTRDGSSDACLQRCRGRTVKYQSSSQEREVSRER